MKKTKKTEAEKKALVAWYVDVFLPHVKKARKERGR